MLNQLPNWAWALLPTAALIFLLWRQRQPAAAEAPQPVRRAEPLASLQEEMLRGLLRKEGLLPPEPPRPPAGEPAVFVCPQRFKIVPVGKE